MNKRILILGGYGVFGGYLSEYLASLPDTEILVAGRSAAKARAFCDQHGGSPVTLDISAPDVASKIAALAPHIVVDAAGPFQAYGAAPYRIAEAAIACGAHYLDLSDDAAFTAGIGFLDGPARAAGVMVLSGASSVPALSSAAAGALIDGLSDVHVIESTILPGNRAPRGLSVIRSILRQAGQPLRLWRGGEWESVTGWSDRQSLSLSAKRAPPLKSRWASLIGAPDLVLFPEHFNARSVLFRAGLDLKLMHGGLGCLSALVRIGALKSLSPLARPLKWAADRLEPFGSDRGAMRVRVAGQTDAGGFEERIWTLVISSGDGPRVPTIPARILCARIIAGDITPGARPCIEAFTLDEAEHTLSALDAVTERTARSLTPLFEHALGPSFANLPRALQDLHTVIDVRHWRGKASVIRGTNLISRLVGWLVGFPPATPSTDVHVGMRRTPKGETWTRRFGRYTFRSYLAPARHNASGHVTERFGLLTFRIDLAPSEQDLSFPVSRGDALGLPLPALLLPVSKTREYADEAGRACFDVSIALPLIGQIVGYRGYLVPV